MYTRDELRALGVRYIVEWPAAIMYYSANEEEEMRAEVARSGSRATVEEI